MSRLLFLVATVIAAFAVAACGDGGEGSSTSDSETATEPSRPPHVVTRDWLITDLGTFGTDEMTADEINERGAVLGTGLTRKIDAWGRPGRIYDTFLWRNGEFTESGRLTFIAINDRGEIASDIGGVAALWERGAIRRLGTLGGESSRVAAINSKGHVVGWADTKSSQHAFLWADGEMRDLGSLGSSSWSAANAINDHGQVVGVSGTLTASGKRRAFLWENGRMKDLGMFSGRPDADYEAVAVNEHGQVLVLTEDVPSEDPDAVDRWFLWEDGKFTDLGTLGGVGIRSSSLNNLGQVVGASGTAHGEYHAFLWEDGQMTDLGALARWWSFAGAINTRGQVVGCSDTPPYRDRHAVLWWDGAITDLGTLDGGRSSCATDINDRGEIVGWSEGRNGKQHAVLWTLKR